MNGPITRLNAAVDTLKGWGWTNRMINAAMDQYQYADDQIEFFETQVAAGEKANREGVAAMRAAK